MSMPKRSRNRRDVAAGSGAPAEITVRTVRNSPSSFGIAARCSNIIGIPGSTVHEWRFARSRIDCGM
jgi:hypothetical protein